MPVKLPLVSERRRGNGMTVNLLECKSVVYFDVSTPIIESSSVKKSLKKDDNWFLL